MMSRTFALIPAAGKSQRMGRPKLSMPLAGRTVLECVLDTLRQAGITEVVVVVGPDSTDLAKRAEAAGVNVVPLPNETGDMQATVIEGLQWLETHFQPSPEDGWLLLPADHPALDPVVIQELLSAKAGQPGKSIFIPTFAGRRGHPAWVGWNHLSALRAWPAGQGLNRFLRAHAEQTWECPVSSATVLCDLDTPEDYQHLLKTWPAS